MEQDALYRTLDIRIGTPLAAATDDGTAGGWLTDTANTTKWQLDVKTFLCPGRSRTRGHKTGTGAGRAGPVTDYAINTRINSPGTMGADNTTNDDDWINNGSDAADDRRSKVQQIKDGSSNTILVGIKALRESEFSDNDANNWDEAILQGQWGGSARRGNEPATLAGFVLVQDNPSRPVGDFSARFGGPFSGGSLFTMGDGSVRTVTYNVSPAALRAALNPSDGQTISLD